MGSSIELFIIEQYQYQEHYRALYIGTVPVWGALENSLYWHSPSIKSSIELFILEQSQYQELFILEQPQYQELCWALYIRRVPIWGALYIKIVPVPFICCKPHMVGCMNIQSKQCFSLFHWYIFACLLKTFNSWFQFIFVIIINFLLCHQHLQRYSHTIRFSHLSSHARVEGILILCRAHLLSPYHLLQFHIIVILEIAHTLSFNMSLNLWTERRKRRGGRETWWTGKIWRNWGV